MSIQNKTPVRGGGVQTSQMLYKSCSTPMACLKWVTDDVTSSRTRTSFSMSRWRHHLVWPFTSVTDYLSRPTNWLPVWYLMHKQHCRFLPENVLYSIVYGSISKESDDEKPSVFCFASEPVWCFCFFLYEDNRVYLAARPLSVFRSGLVEPISRSRLI